MSTVNNANNQTVSKRRGPDSRFVWGLVAVIILGVSFSLYSLGNSMIPNQIKPPTTLEDYKNLPGARWVYTLNYEKDGETKTVEFAFRWCPAGTFTMGSPETEVGRDPDETEHQVTLTKDFWMLESEVTQDQFEKIMGYNPSCNKGSLNPVDSVSWNDCQEFCKKCRQRGLPLQLPTEAQWEYSCRAGFKGKSQTELTKMAWFSDNSDGRSHEIGQKLPNRWGLSGMHGNVWEWCQDMFGEYSNESVTDPCGPNSGNEHVIRGGAWSSAAAQCRSANRGCHKPDYRDNRLGFRVVIIP